MRLVLLRPDNNHAIALPDHTLLSTPHTLPHLCLQVLPLSTHPHSKPYTSMDYLTSLTNRKTTTYLNRHLLPRFPLPQVTVITNTASWSQCPTPAHPTFLHVRPFPPCPALPLDYPLSSTAVHPVIFPPSCPTFILSNLSHHTPSKDLVPSASMRSASATFTYKPPKGLSHLRTPFMYRTLKSASSPYSFLANPISTPTSIQNKGTVSFPTTRTMSLPVALPSPIPNSLSFSIFSRTSLAPYPRPHLLTILHNSQKLTLGTNVLDIVA